MTVQRAPAQGHREGASAQRSIHPAADRCRIPALKAAPWPPLGSALSNADWRPSWGVRGVGAAHRTAVDPIVASHTGRPRGHALLEFGGSGGDESNKPPEGEAAQHKKAAAPYRDYIGFPD